MKFPALSKVFAAGNFYHLINNFPIVISPFSEKRLIWFFWGRLIWRFLPFLSFCCWQDDFLYHLIIISLLWYHPLLRKANLIFLRKISLKVLALSIFLLLAGLFLSVKLRYDPITFGICRFFSIRERWWWKIFLRNNILDTVCAFL